MGVFFDIRKRLKSQENLYLVLSLLLFTVAMTLYQVQTYDTFMHIKSGELIINTRSIPQQDPFSFVTGQRTWINHQWLSQVILYLTHSLLGVPGLTALGTVGAMLCLVLVLLTVRLRSGRFIVSSFAMILMILGARSRFSPRPEVFSLILICLLHCLLTYCLLTNNKKPALGSICLLFPVLMVLWVNLHASFIFAYLLIAMHIMGRILDRSAYSQPMDKRALAMVTGSTLISIPLLMLNPNGVKSILYPITLYGGKLYTAQIQEWMPSELSWSYAPFWIFLILWAISFLVSFSRVSFVDLFIYLLTAYMAYYSRRHIALFLLLNTPSLVSNLQGAIGRLGKLRLNMNIQRKCYVFGTALLIALSVIIPLAQDGYRFGIGIREGVFPVQAAEFIKQNGISGNMVNPYHWGGYLLYSLYPQCKVFVDGRSLLYGERILKEYEALATGRLPLAPFLEQYNVRLAVCEYSRNDKDNSAIQDALAQNKDFILVYWDNSSMVYIKSGNEFRDIISRFAYFLIDPNRKDLAHVPDDKLDDLEADLCLSLSLVPDNPRAYKIFSLLAYRKGKIKEAIRWADQALELQSEDADCYYNLGCFYGEIGAHRRSIKNYRRALRCNARHFRALNNLGVIFNEMGDKRRAIKYFSRALEVEPTFSPALINLATELLTQERIKQATRYIERYLAESQPTAPVLNLLGVCYGKRGNSAKALELFRQALSIDPGYLPARQNLHGIMVISNIEYD